MANMLTYEEITDISQDRKIGIVRTAEKVGMTIAGFRTAVKKKTLSAEKILSLCEVLSIDPNYLLGWKTSTVAGDVVYGDQQKGAKKQIMHKDSPELRRAVEVLQAQLEEKDRQIAKLIEKL